ncbi:hypothetical protein PUATCC27989T_01019 [Phytobacter ursingii]|nr:hypothetical protein PUATCC27989T_01019 [Phytobacter ursingii]
MNNKQPLSSTCAKEALSNGITYRQLLVAQIAPVFANRFLNNDDWQDYDDMAGSIMMMADAIITAEQETSE